MRSGNRKSQTTNPRLVQDDQVVERLRKQRDGLLRDVSLEFQDKSSVIRSRSSRRLDLLSRPAAHRLHPYGAGHPLHDETGKVAGQLQLQAAMGKRAEALAGLSPRFLRALCVLCGK